MNIEPGAKKPVNVNPNWTSGAVRLWNIGISLGVAVWILAVGAVLAHGTDGALDFDQGWRLWLDPQAQWKNDQLFLPDEVNLDTLPVNPPTGGWTALTETAGIAVSLPSSVEEHYWGKPPATTPASNSPNDVIRVGGCYYGVSWWYRTFEPPALAPGERLIFSFPAARMRSEVYVNGRLISYNLISEVPFTADATDALKPAGQNVIAVRITNPGGEFDWYDGTMDWGHYKIPSSRAIGGIAGGVEMEVRGPVNVSDLAVLNKPDLSSATLEAEVASAGPAYNGPVLLSITQGEKQVWSGSASVDVPAHGQATVAVPASVKNAEIWDVDRPNLYQAHASIPGTRHSDRSATFGFRWFDAKGVGADAKLYLNGRRIVPRSAISWGWWAPNGLFPDQAAVDREIASMRALGLDSLQNHRHMPKAIVLDSFDRAGLLRYCEPGAGSTSMEDHMKNVGSTQPPVDTSGKGAQLDFLNKYELAKILAMIKAGRSHPCVTLWTVQNEVSPDLHNPNIFYVLNAMRAADPSRIIVLKSGITPLNQVWSLPYSSDWMHDDGTGFSGWRDEHTANSSPGVYQDSMYKSPKNYAYYSDVQKEVMVWGELATGASPDDHQLIVDWYKSHDASGFDKAAHETLLSAYDKFLDDYQFRAAFPKAEDLFRAAGAKHYFSAAHMLENARMCNNVDYIALSGWESNYRENHSGLVDSLRELKSDPSLIKEASQPEALVIRLPHYVVAKGGAALVDVHQINENNLAGPYGLTVTATLPGAKPFFHATFPVNLTGGETYGQLLEDNIRIPVNEEGQVTVHASLAALNGASPILEKSEPFLVVDPKPAAITAKIAYAGPAEAIDHALQTQFGVSAVPLAAAQGSLDTIIVASKPSSTAWRAFDSSETISDTTDPDLFKHQLFGRSGDLCDVKNLAPGLAKVDLYFAETYFDSKGSRVFDVALNNRTVLKNFDIFAESGGKNRALVKSFNIDAPKGEVLLSIPASEKDNAMLAAVQVTDSAGRVMREVFRDRAYQDSSGREWKPFDFEDFRWAAILPPALTRVQNDGTRLVLLTTGGKDAESAASFLADQKILHYRGPAGGSGASWLGFWYFGKKHWLLDGLPADCVLDWPYQIGMGNGLLIGGPNVDAVVGYGRNHDANIGLAASVISCGKGQIVFLCLPGLEAAFVSDDPANFQLVTAKRILFNAIAGK